jgi:hypothetical protein
MQVKVSVGRKLFLSHLLAVILVSGSIGTYFYLSAVRSLMHSLKTRLQNSAALVSQVMDASGLDGITGPEAAKSPAYQEYLRLLRDFRHANPDVAFLYLMRRDGDRVTFVVDSDETADQALPGQAYEETVPALLAGFQAPSVDDRIYSDRWGSFLSGYSPVRNGAGRYLVGLDMRADEVQRKFRRLRVSGLVSLACSVLLALLFSRAMSSHFLRNIKALVARCGAIASGHLDEVIPLRTRDEFDSLVEAFNSMSVDLGRTRRMNSEQAEELRRGRDELEVRVRERTRDLQEALAKVKTLGGLLPICASCKKIRDDGGYWQQVEKFLEEHSEAHFTHGICPACRSRLYPDLEGKPEDEGAC